MPAKTNNGKKFTPPPSIKVNPTDFQKVRTSFKLENPKKNNKTGKLNMYTKWGNTGKVPKYLLPMLQSRFGVNYYVHESSKDGKGGWSISVTATARAPPRIKDESDEEYEQRCADAQALVEQYFNNWETSDEMIRDYFIEHYETISGKEDVSVEERRILAKEAVGQNVKQPKKDTNFPRSMTFKIKPTEETENLKPGKQKPNIAVFYEDLDEETGTVKGYTPVEVNTFEELEVLAGPNSDVAVVIDGYIWYVSKKLGYSLSVSQLLLVRKESDNPNDCAFGAVLPKAIPVKAKVEVPQKGEVPQKEEEQPIQEVANIPEEKKEEEAPEGKDSDSDSD